MPWSVKQSTELCPASKPWAVVKDDDGSLVACHETEAGANDQQAALYANEEREALHVCECLDCGHTVETAEHCTDLECPECGGEMRRQERPGQGRGRMDIRTMWERVKGLFELSLDAAEAEGLERAWDGSASNYDSTEAYCAACLIDVNSAAGRDTKAQSHCMLPVKSPGSDAYNMEGIMAAAGGHGISQVQKPDDVPADAWASAKKSAANVIISEYNKDDRTAPDSVYEVAGKEPPERARTLALGRISEQVSTLLYQREGWAWPVDFYLDGGEFYLLAAEEGLLYRVPVQIEGETVSLGDWQQVTEVHQPVGRSRTVVVRQADDVWRWFSIAATAVLNRVGEIDSTELFDRMVERFAAGEPARRDFFHLGEAASFGEVDWLEREGWCLLASGTFDDSPLGRAMRRAIQAEPDKWGDSISYLPQAEAEMVEVAEGVHVPVYNDGVLRFISSVYEDSAASLFTVTRVQEVTRMRKEIEEALRGLTAHGLTDDEVDEIITAVDQTNRSIDEAGLIARAAESETETETDQEPETEAPVEREIVVDEETMQALVEAVLSTEQMDETRRRVNELGQQVEGLVAEFEERLAELREADEGFTQRLIPLEQDEAARQERWTQDLGRRQRRELTTRVTYRPREAPPDGDGGGERSLADVAEETLSGWER